jgi:hypothetical protein
MVDEWMALKEELDAFVREEAVWKVTDNVEESTMGFGTSRPLRRWFLKHSYEGESFETLLQLDEIILPGKAPTTVNGRHVTHVLMSSLLSGQSKIYIYFFSASDSGAVINTVETKLGIRGHTEKLEVSDYRI